MNKDRPDFLIVGAMKCGTTSLIFHLNNHRKIAMSPIEMHYFDRDENFQKGPSWYMEYLNSRCDEQTLLLGEKTTNYSYQANVPERIADFDKDMKLVWVFREPVKRAYSNYMHGFRDGSLRYSFEEAIAREKELIKQNVFFGYMERSRYYKQVERYLEHFPREQMHFILFEDFIKDTEGELKRLFDFLGCPHEGFVFKDEPRNMTVHPRWQTSVWLSRKLAGRGLLWKATKYINVFMKKPGYPKLDSAHYEQLKTRFAEDNARLAQLTGLDLSAWGPKG